MTRFYYWILTTIAGSVLGSSFSNWFENTRVGIWFYAKVDSLMNWAADRYKLERLKTVNRFYEKYPEISQRLDRIEEQLKK
jgi:hypothetical protein